MKILKIFGEAALVTVILAVTGFSAGAQNGMSSLKDVPDAGSYGTTIMNKNTKDLANVKAVVFPHWLHRISYNCETCHNATGLPMNANTVDIKQADIESGKYCGKCHDGKTAFAANKCEKCHTYGTDAKGGAAAAALKNLPADDFGNRVNWVTAMNEKKLKAAELNALDLDIVIPVTKFTPAPPDVLFPHKAHTRLLDCAACHPAVFNQKKGGNPDMNMIKIISGQYCGTCHGKVAFPLTDCYRCHSQPAKKAPEIGPIPDIDANKGLPKDKKRK